MTLPTVSLSEFIIGTRVHVSSSAVIAHSTSGDVIDDNSIPFLQFELGVRTTKLKTSSDNIYLEAA